LTGLKTGFNEAFYIETPLRNAMLKDDPSSEHLFKKFLRGRDVKRWFSVWDDQWHIVIPSSHNRAWPWSNAASETEAETIFAAMHPPIHAHLKQFEQPLRARQDKGKYWWELRACDYYDDFAKPKIVVQCIAYYSQFAFDEQGLYANNKAIIIPTSDFYLLAVLNSRIIWWIVNRTFQHMKDEGLSVDVQFLKRLPVPTVSDELRADISRLARELVVAGSLPADLQKTTSLEIEINERVEQAFALSEAERQVLVSCLPPRDPIATLEPKQTATISAEPNVSSRPVGRPIEQTPSTPLRRAGTLPPATRERIGSPDLEGTVGRFDFSFPSKPRPHIATTAELFTLLLPALVQEAGGQLDYEEFLEAMAFLANPPKSSATLPPNAASQFSKWRTNFPSGLVDANALKAALHDHIVMRQTLGIISDGSNFVLFKGVSWVDMTLDWLLFDTRLALAHAVKTQTVDPPWARAVAERDLKAWATA
jgi:hypothetical protein